MTIFPLAPDQTIAQMWSNGVRGESTPQILRLVTICHLVKFSTSNYNGWRAEITEIFGHWGHTLWGRGKFDPKNPSPGLDVLSC